MMCFRKAGFALTALLGLALAAPALAANPLAGRQQAAADTGEHPPNPAGLTNIQAMVADCDDMLRLIDDIRRLDNQMLGTIDSSNQTLTNIASLIDAINTRHQQQSTPATTPPAPTPPANPPL